MFNNFLDSLNLTQLFVVYLLFGCFIGISAGFILSFFINKKIKNKRKCKSMSKDNLDMKDCDNYNIILDYCDTEYNSSCDSDNNSCDFGSNDFSD